MSIYAQSTLGTAANQLTFNDYTAFPIYRVISRQPQQRQIRDYDLPVPFESGISDFETLIGKTAYVIDGVMYPSGESDYDNGLRALRKLASLDVEQADNNSDNGYVPYVFGEFNQNKQIFMKVLYVDLPESTRKGLVQPFRLICKVKDPTIYGATQKTVSTAAASFTAALGTAIYSFKYPIIFGASTSSVSATGVNAGDVPVYPLSITIQGPVNRPKITNTTTGEYIEVNTNLATSSNYLRITYDKDTLSVETDGVSVLGSVITGSTYFKIPVGTSNYTLTGSSISSSSYAQIAYFDGYALS